MSPSDTITLTGWTMVEGVNVEVTLTVDTVALIHWLGAKAARSMHGKASDAKGDVRARVSKSAVLSVSEADQARRKKFAAAHPWRSRGKTAWTES